ncbi:MAG: hypothetical protein K1Y02_26640 [Candidatus Hydrogenedentes bacterium]|nr:hypothetical protein [Candidatus Hydrogenedentota bacterium]
MKTSILLGAVVGMFMLGGVACSAAPEESLGEDQGAAGAPVQPTLAQLAQAAVVMADGSDTFMTTVPFTPAQPPGAPSTQITVQLRVSGYSGGTFSVSGTAGDILLPNGAVIHGTIAKARFEVLQVPMNLPAGSVDLYDALKARNPLYPNVTGVSWTVPLGTVVPPIQWAIDPACPTGSSSQTKLFNHAGTIKKRASGAGFTTVPAGYIAPTNAQIPTSVPFNGDGSTLADYSECAG